MWRFGDGGAGEGATPLPSLSALEAALQFAEHQTLIAIVNRDFARLRFPAPARGSWPAPSADFAVPVAAARFL